MQTTTLEHTGYVPSEGELRRYDLMGGLLVVVMVLGPLLAGAFR